MIYGGEFSMLSRKFVAAAIGIAAAFSISSCKTGLLESPVDNAPVQGRSAPMPDVVDGNRTSYADVVEKASPAVVRIIAEHKETQSQQPMSGGGSPFDDFFRQFGQPQQQQRNQRPQIERGAGSGVIVNANGTILTNNHVVEGAEKLTVFTSDNKSYSAKVIGTDKPSDLAVIKIETENLPFLNLGNSDNVRVGDIVLAIGNPLGIGQSVTAGIISAKGRYTGLSDGSFEDFLQTDAPINRGNSGGALVNLQGELIGINSQILSGGPSGGNIGIGFSIPSNMARSVLDQLLKDGKVHRGQLGIGIQQITDETAEALNIKDQDGVLVTNVTAGSSAEKAGLKRGDIITAINGEKIESGNTLRIKVAGTAPGTSIKLTVMRDGKQEEFDATLDEFSSPDQKGGQSDGKDDDGQPQQQSGKLGLSLQPITPAIAKQLGIDSTDGLVVSDVDPNGAASAAGITRGDVILEVNRKPVSTTADVTEALNAAGDKAVALTVSRRGSVFFVPVKPD